MKKTVRNLFLLVIVLLGLFVVIQFLPIGKDHTNPAVLSEPNWDSANTRALVKRVCFDCHSNETAWPWYSKIAPVSWLIWNDVSEGRQNMNFSEWAQGGSQDLGEIIEVIGEGEMPPAQYLWMHPEAKLTAAEQEALINGLTNSIP